jgi:hypothetical protein
MIDKNFKNMIWTIIDYMISFIKNHLIFNKKTLIWMEISRTDFKIKQALGYMCGLCKHMSGL